MSEYRIQISETTTGSYKIGCPSVLLKSEFCILISDVFAVLHYLTPSRRNGQPALATRPVFLFLTAIGIPS